jgi:serine phosphatase RsbU (regulator of sigma subunit)
LEADKGALVSAPAAMRVSSAVRSYDGGQRCGDVASLLPLSSGRTAIVVIDVAGHGTARAPLSTALAEVVTASLRRDGSPALAINCADQLLLASGDESPYAVAFVALVNPVFRTVVYASAGHDVAFTLADDGRIRHLAQTAPMLGLPLTNNACDAVFVLDPRETLLDSHA